MKKIKSHKTFQGSTAFWSHQSLVTKTEMKFSTFIPEGEVLGCIIWLSGLTCTEENFISKAGSQKYLAENKLMLIAPDTSPRGLSLPGEHDAYDFGSGAGFYLNATVAPYSDHYKMYDYIVDELYQVIVDHFKQKNISLSGHSMGGHGALVIGLRNPTKFKSISAFSPIVNPSISPWGMKAFSGYLGENQADYSAYDATRLLSLNYKHPAKILINQGTNDEYLLTQLLTENFIKAAEKNQQWLEVNYSEGFDHSYYFIASFIEEHILHHAHFLKER